MKKTVTSIIVFACTAAMLCGCKGKKDNDRLSAPYSIPDKINSGSSEVSNITSDETFEETGSVSSKTSKSESKKNDSTITVFDEVKADGKAEDIDFPPENTESQTTSESKENKEPENSKNSEEKAPGENKTPSEKPSEDKNSSGTVSKDTMFGWSVWK